MTTTAVTTAQPPDPAASRRAFQTKLSAIDHAQSASPEAIQLKKSEDEARLHGYDVMADLARDERENAAIFAALNRGDDAEYLALTEARDRRNLLKARGLTA